VLSEHCRSDSAETIAGDVGFGNEGGQSAMFIILSVINIYRVFQKELYNFESL
jgi:hypothetical protein